MNDLEKLVAYTRISKIKIQKKFGHAFVVGNRIYVDYEGSNVHFKINSVCGQVFLFLLDHKGHWKTRDDIGAYLDTAAVVFASNSLEGYVGNVKFKLKTSRYYTIENGSQIGRSTEYRLVDR